MLRQSFAGLSKLIDGIFEEQFSVEAVSLVTYPSDVQWVVSVVS